MQTSGLLQDFSAKLDMEIKLRHEVHNTSFYSTKILDAMLTREDRTETRQQGCWNHIRNGECSADCVIISTFVSPMCNIEPRGPLLCTSLIAHFLLSRIHPAVTLSLFCEVHMSIPCPSSRSCSTVRSTVYDFREKSRPCTCSDLH